MARRQMHLYVRPDWVDEVQALALATRLTPTWLYAAAVAAGHASSDDVLVPAIMEDAARGGERIAFLVADVVGDRLRHRTTGHASDIVPMSAQRIGRALLSHGWPQVRRAQMPFVRPYPSQATSVDHDADCPLSPQDAGLILEDIRHVALALRTHPRPDRVADMFRHRRIGLEETGVDHGMVFDLCPLCGRPRERRGRIRGCGVRPRDLIVTCEALRAPDRGSRYAAPTPVQFLALCPPSVEGRPFTEPRQRLSALPHDEFPALVAWARAIGAAADEFESYASQRHTAHKELHR
jgi:hypothetical protein